MRHKNITPLSSLSSNVLIFYEKKKIIIILLWICNETKTAPRWNLHIKLKTFEWEIMQWKFLCGNSNLLKGFRKQSRHKMLNHHENLKWSASFPFLSKQKIDFTNVFSANSFSKTPIALTYRYWYGVTSVCFFSSYMLNVEGFVCWKSVMESKK